MQLIYPCQDISLQLGLRLSEESPIRSTAMVDSMLGPSRRPQEYAFNAPVHHVWKAAVNRRWAPNVGYVPVCGLETVHVGIALMAERDRICCALGLASLTPYNVLYSNEVIFDEWENCSSKR